MNANHIYRVVWSEVHEAWIAVSEITRTRGKRQAIALALPLALFSVNAGAEGKPTTVVPTGGSTSAYYSANGVPVVNIDTANAAGLSHNRYTRYDVDGKGLVLNNGNLSQIERASQLAGSVLANPNLNREARVILNEVVSTNRSSLAGFTEVVGSRADVVVANPNGITCSGCGFINTDRATLTTGTPQINAGGSLTGFAVERGDLLIQGSGLNASGQQILDLVARSIKVDAPVNVGGSLQLVAGPNTWSYDTRSVTGTTGGSGPVPSYAIDSSALGGMYAGRIRLIATEAGVGVRMLGEAAATADDFGIDATGRILVQTKLSARRDMSLATAGDIALASADTELSAGGNLAVSTTTGSGGDIDNEGLLLSGGALTVAADRSIVNGTNAAMSAPSGELKLTAATGDLTNAGWLYAGTQLTARADKGTFTNAGTGTIWSDGGMTLSADILVNNHWIQAADDIAIATTTRFSNELEGARTLEKLDDESTAAYYGYYGITHSKQDDAWVYYDNIYVYGISKTVKQKFNRDVPSYDEQPVAVVAGHDLTIDAGASSLDAAASAFNNTGAVLSAGHDLTLRGTGSARNDALYLGTNQYEKRWAYHNYSAGLDEFDFYAVTTKQQYDAGVPYYPAGSNDVTWPDPPWFHVGYADSTDGYHILWNKAQSDAQWILVKQVAGQTRIIRDAVIHAGGEIKIPDGGVQLTNNGTRLEGSPASYGQTNSAKASVPTNPNGYFVAVLDSSAGYLIETNPRYGLGSDYAGSDYLLKSLGIDPETTEKRLGDANYEAYLIRQQLIKQAGSAILDGYASEAAQMQRLMDQAASQSAGLGLTLGAALTAEQLAGLKQDIVWMVETTVNGQKVLQPVVYLAAESREAIVSGAVIAGREINMNVASLENTGGMITASQSLNVVAQGDITNTSGSIKGGDVSLESTQGSIINRTYAEGRGDLKSNYQTTVGKTASIEATGTLTLDADRNIGIQGAEVRAGGDASLTAGGDITADTVVDKTTTMTKTSGSTGLLSKTGPTTATVATEKNIGSTISTGGKLTLTSGGDTTLAGTQAKVGGDLTVNAGGDFNILSRQDKTAIHSESTTTGIGVGGGLWGTEKTTVDDFTGKNFGSAISVGGKADIDAAGDMTLRGSSLDIGKSATIDSRSVTIEQGLDEKHTVTRTESTTFLSTGSDKHRAKTGDASASSSGAAASASANASASAGAGESSELNLIEQRTTTVDHTKTTGVASRLSTGGDLTLTIGENVTVQGSTVDAGQALNINAKRIDILAGENKEKTTTTTEATKIGLYTDSKAEAEAEAGASATAMSATAKVGASAGASANSTVTVGTRIESGTDETTSLTHTAASLKSGGAMTLTADEEARFVGAKVQSGGDLSITAQDITSLAAEDKTTTTHDATTRTAGIYFEGNASGEIKGSLSAGPGNDAAAGGIDAKAEASTGLRFNQKTESSEEGATHNMVSTFKSGGSITRTAKGATGATGTITDQGTQLDARGDITQSAATLKEIAAEDKNWSSSSTETHDGRLGIYAGAGVSGDAGAQTSVLSTGKYAEDLGPEASAGFQAKYSYDKTSESASDSTAVTTRYKAGGSITSTTTEKTTLIGTQFEAGQDVNLTAGSLDYQAAKDTSATASASRSIDAEGKAKMTGTTGFEASGGYEQSASSSSTSTARAGGIVAGGNVTVSTTNDARFEGTTIDSGGTAKIESTAGNVTFDAARDTTHEESSGFNVGASFGSTKQAGKDAKKDAKDEHESKTTLGGGYSTGKSDSTTETGASINARNIEISAGKDTTLHGTQVDAAENASVKAQGDVKLLEATNSSSGSSFGISGNATGMNLTKPDGENSKAQYGSGNVNVANKERNTGTATSIKSGGDLTVKGTNIISQQAGYSAGGNLVTEGAVTTQDLTNVNKGMKVDANMSFVHKSTSKAKGKDDKPDAKASPESKEKKTVSKTKKTLRKNIRPTAGEGGQAGSKPAGSPVR